MAIRVLISGSTEVTVGKWCPYQVVGPDGEISNID